MTAMQRSSHGEASSGEPGCRAGWLCHPPDLRYEASAFASPAHSNLSYESVPSMTRLHPLRNLLFMFKSLISC